MQFELWLCARTADVQKHYWNLLKDSKWNKNRNEMPKYAVLEVVLENQIDFNEKENMTKNIINRSLFISFGEMPDFMGGLAEGIEKSRGLVEKAVHGVAADMVVNPKVSVMERTQMQTASVDSIR